MSVPWVRLFRSSPVAGPSATYYSIRFLDDHAGWGCKSNGGNPRCFTLRPHVLYLFYTAVPFSSMCIPFRTTVTLHYTSQHRHDGHRAEPGPQGRDGGCTLALRWKEGGGTGVTSYYLFGIFFVENIKMSSDLFADSRRPHPTTLFHNNIVY